MATANPTTPATINGIQNLDTNSLYVVVNKVYATPRVASNTVYDFILAASDVANDGTGGCCPFDSIYASLSFWSPTNSVSYTLF